MDPERLKDTARPCGCCSARATPGPTERAVSHGGLGRNRCVQTFGVWPSELKSAWSRASAGSGWSHTHTVILSYPWVLRRSDTLKRPVRNQYYFKTAQSKATTSHENENGGYMLVSRWVTDFAKIYLLVTILKIIDDDWGGRTGTTTKTPLHFWICSTIKKASTSI